MGGSLFTIDGEDAATQHGKLKSVLSNPRIIASTEACCRNKVETILLRLLAYMSSIGTPFDVQELMLRFMFDLATMSLFDVDP
uniref:Uncharacterized protein n=1 Tax=Triticum urartu TaxID=4572 RepID=A0A8R7TBP9_TRIUA